MNTSTITSSIHTVTVPNLVARVVPHARAANDTSRHDAERIAHARAVERLYGEAYASLIGAALRHVDDRADAADVVQEAFTRLLETPHRKPTRAAAWAIVRDLAHERRAEQMLCEPYVEDDPDIVEDAAGAWLARALGG